MVKSILEIGNAKYKIDKLALCRFKEEARQNAVTPTDEREAMTGIASGVGSLDESLDKVFNEVMQLYQEYARSESVDALVRLKDKLEQVSLRYKSLTLAEEVLNINSCLPYERRVPAGAQTGGYKH